MQNQSAQQRAAMLQERQRQQQKAAHEMAAQDSVAQSVSAGPLFSTVHADVRRVPVERGGDGSCRAGGRGEKGCKDFGPWCPQISRERVLLGFWTEGRSVAGALVLAHSLLAEPCSPSAPTRLTIPSPSPAHTHCRR